MSIFRSGPIRVADRVADLLVEAGLRDVFMVSGGGAMHLNDAFGRHPGLRVTCFHHEQAAAMAADGYARLGDRPAIVNVTSGPGAMNAVNGVAGAYLDSLPMVVIGGQMKRVTLVRSTGLPLRQFGDQEIDAISMVRGITKYAVSVDDPLAVRHHVQRALHLAVTGRPGPVWVELPVDVQSTPVDPADEQHYDPTQDDEKQRGASDIADSVERIAELLEASSRPVLYVGSGVRLAGAHRELDELVSRLGIPVVTCLNAHDLVDADTPQLVGRPGTIGDRAGNFAVQNADLVVILGTRLPIRQIGYNWESWAPQAHVVMVDIDAAEMAKPSIHVETPVHADLAELMPALLRRLADWQPSTPQREWLRWCRDRRERYPVVLPQYREVSSPVNPYVAIEAIFRALPANGIVVSGDGWAGVGSAQASVLHTGQRAYSNSGAGSMGHDLPAALGAAIANPGRHVVCIAGDGSLQMNIQELQTLAHHQLPITLIILNNGGYHSIRQTQQNFFPGGEIGFDAESGVSFPDFGRVAQAYGLPFTRVECGDDLPSVLAELYREAQPTVCEIVVDRAQQFAPKAGSRALPDGSMISAPLDDMAPYLDREEHAQSMLPKPASLKPNSIRPISTAPVSCEAAPTAGRR